MPDDQVEAEHIVQVRVPIGLYQAALHAVKANDETISRVVRRALRDYVAAQPRQLDLETAIAVQRRRSTRKTNLEC